MMDSEMKKHLRDRRKKQLLMIALVPGCGVRWGKGRM
jgi:hypothetical protein